LFSSSDDPSPTGGSPKELSTAPTPKRSPHASSREESSFPQSNQNQNQNQVRATTSFHSTNPFLDSNSDDPFRENEVTKQTINNILNATTNNNNNNNNFNNDGHTNNFTNGTTTTTTTATNVSMTPNNRSDFGFGDILTDLNKPMSAPTTPASHTKLDGTHPFEKQSSVTTSLDSVAMDCSRCLKLVERDSGMIKNGKFYCRRCSFLV